jgi:ribosomal protein S18 acetylase RimI-like enzyme
VRRLPWDSDFFGFEIGSASLPESSFADAVGEARDASVSLLYLFVAADDLQGVREACAAGARLVDLRITLDADRPVDDSRVSTRLASSVDLQLLEPLARELAVASRFRADNRIPGAKVEEMYAIWLRRCLEEGVVSVTTDERAFVGALRSGECTHIELVYVDPADRGRGVGRALLVDAFRALPSPRAEVVTQMGNVAAQRLYQAAGFRTHSATAVLHLWLDS